MSLYGIAEPVGGGNKRVHHILRGHGAIRYPEFHENLVLDSQFVKDISHAAVFFRCREEFGYIFLIVHPAGQKSQQDKTAKEDYIENRTPLPEKTVDGQSQTSHLFFADSLEEEVVELTEVGCFHQVGTLDLDVESFFNQGYKVYQ